MTLLQLILAFVQLATNPGSASSGSASTLSSSGS